MGIHGTYIHTYKKRFRTEYTYVYSFTHTIAGRSRLGARRNLQRTRPREVTCPEEGRVLLIDWGMGVLVTLFQTCLCGGVGRLTKAMRTFLFFWFVVYVGICLLGMYIYWGYIFTGDIYLLEMYIIYLFPLYIYSPIQKNRY